VVVVSSFLLSARGVLSLGFKKPPKYRPNNIKAANSNNTTMIIKPLLDDFFCNWFYHFIYIKFINH
jgi:hypothetical protein